VITPEHLSDIWVLVFAGITACSPIVVALLTKKWGRNVGRSQTPARAEASDLSHALDLAIIEHRHTQQMIRDHATEMRSHFDRLLRYVLPAHVPPDMMAKIKALDDIGSRSGRLPNTA
jgi:hypothetical protein